MPGETRRAQYAVLWQEDADPVSVGRLEVGDGMFTLTGKERGGPSRQCRVALSTIRAVRIGRMENERLDGMLTLVVERHRAEPILIAQATGIGAIHELADQLALALPAL